MQRLPAAAAILAAGVGAIALTPAVRAETYGNTEPFETQSNHGASYVLGTQVVIPVGDFRLESFGLMYGHEDFGDPQASNARFALYTSGRDSLPDTLVAATGEIFLSEVATIDLIPFTSTPVVDAGVYWMMALYQSGASPRRTADPNSLVSYWSNPYGNGFPANPPEVINYQGADFNYWVNGTIESGCGYVLKKSKSKGGCESCPARGESYHTRDECEKVRDCVKKLNTTIACPDGRNGLCKLKGKRASCG